ncbi:MAG: NAD(P)/FAD-dependent oxidoreductase [Hahellaceae bacterium]|nr:NAD(P)/FAD-dependent oxidoreductase [Hahellaceae bacterium]MCP5169256.1 NAD(P)/FAD-dependent oxidoreductase [Hahellaceae bacterium]
MQTAIDFLEPTHILNDSPALNFGKRQQVLIVGAGPVGIRLRQLLHKKGFDGDVHVFGDEPWAPYDRVQLSPFLDGKRNLESLSLEDRTAKEADENFHAHCRVEHIDKVHRLITTNRNETYYYDHLILATGSRAFVPTMPGRDLSNVLTFRDLRDAQTLMARMTRSRTTVVVGGGLLGIETAIALNRYHTRVIIIQQPDFLMNRQLDETAATMLRSQLHAQGVEVRTGQGVREILGSYQAEGVRLRDGTVITCDTVVFCSGIQPNIELARDAWVKVRQGIVIDNQLATSDPNIYAIGECAEYNQKIYGFANPGMEQAEVLADRLCGGSGLYTGSLVHSRLKLSECPVFTIGITHDEAQGSRYQILSYRDEPQSIYRKLILDGRILVGAMAFGTWPEAHSLGHMIQIGHRVSALECWQFRKTGDLSQHQNLSSIAHWPATQTICQCKGVSRGALSEAIQGGCASVSELRACTGASSVCGSCEPMLDALLGDTSKVQRGSGIFSYTLIAMFVFATLAAIPFVSHYWSGTEQWSSTSWDLRHLSRDGFWQQVSGFSAFGLALLSLTVSARKRIKPNRWSALKVVGKFSLWRNLHLILASAMALALMLHTGFSPGNNLNRLLVMDVLLIALAGALLALLISYGEKQRPVPDPLRKTAFWSHLLLFWPLPALLSMHIVSVYYF